MAAENEKKKNIEKNIQKNKSFRKEVKEKQMRNKKKMIAMERE